MTAPLACSATRPVSIESRLPATSTFFVTTATSDTSMCVGGDPRRRDLGQVPSSRRRGLALARLSRNLDDLGEGFSELTRATSVGSSRIYLRAPGGRPALGRTIS